MRRAFAVVVAVGALLGASSPATLAKEPKSPTAVAACKRATIGGQSKCIARGQYCARRYQRDYLRYGLSCSKRDVRGRYHLA